MKLMKISVSGLSLFNGICEIDFLARQRVTEENTEKMNGVFSTGRQYIYQNNVMSFIGINASGKTTILKLITFVGKLLANEPINTMDCRDVLDGLDENKKICFEIFYYAEDDTVNRLHTVVGMRKGRYVILEETLSTKPASRITSKKNMYDFTDQHILISRDNNDAFLLEDVSIMVAYNKKFPKKLLMTDMLQYTNINQLNITEDCPPELIAFFDPSVEYLHVSKNGKDMDIRLKFKEKEEIKLNQLTDLNRYLSSGTIKGINIFQSAIETFQYGGYLLVDELENHFNHEIVSTLIRFYMDVRMNPNGAMLIFSTHYPELLDEFERNDNIYIVRNQDGIMVENLSVILKRNDLKKSEAYQSGFLEGTVPLYDSYMDLKKSITHKQGV